MTKTMKDRVADARERLIEEPDTAVVRFCASSRPAGGAASAVRLPDHRLDVAAPPGLGEGGGPTAAELLLAALASCQEVAYRAWAAALNLPLDDVQVEVEGEMDFRGFFAVCPNARPGFRRISARVRMVSDAPPAALERLRRAVEEHCPLLDMLSRPVPVTVDLATESVDQAA